MPRSLRVYAATSATIEAVCPFLRQYFPRFTNKVAGQDGKQRLLQVRKNKKARRSGLL
jgi:hypothetical protein